MSATASGAKAALTTARRHIRRYFAGLSVGGMMMALLFFCFSMTPSLLPRTWYIQGFASGICTITGYAVGVLIGWILRRFGFRPLQLAHHRRTIIRLLQVSACLLIPLFGLLGAYWQYQVRELTHGDRGDSSYYALVLLIGFALARLLLDLARLLRWVTRRIGRFGARWIPAPIAKLVAAGLVIGLVVIIVNDAFLPPIINVSNSSFSLTDKGTEPGIAAPTAAERSGSPASPVRWDELGREGRSFVSRGPTAQQITEFRHSPAREPIRVYVGEQSTETLEVEADLVVDELKRTGAFDRAVLAVASTTGRGWINWVGAAALEYLWDGDTAIASMQYSYLPSAVAFLADHATPPEASTILFDAVHREWESHPASHRPQLIVFGESLGSFGSEGAFASLADVEAQTDGAVWVGTPDFTPLWRQITDDRDADLPEQVPAIDNCEQVCFAANGTNLSAGAHPSVVYLQHTNDPIVWWSPDLLLERPDWLREPAQPARPIAMTWIPFVTFWQVTTDIIFSTDMPDGYGHHYGVGYVNAFAAVVPPPDWTADDTALLREQLAEMPTGE